MTLAIIIPTLRAEQDLQRTLPCISKVVDVALIWTVDSSSEDGTLSICKSYGVNTYVIKRADFNHGGTRNLARSLVQADILVYMTQDAVPASEDFIEKLLIPFQDPQVAIVYGRQLPHPGAGPLEAFPRLFNYPDHSFVKSKADLPRLGIKTFFCSDSFCAYRATAWDAVGGFPEHTLTWEDQHIAARLIAKGYKIAYAADAQVYHSHSYTLKQEFQRYFDTGAFLNGERWMQELAGGAEGEGLRFLKAQIKYLQNTGKTSLIPYALLATAVKYAGYRVGQLEPYLPRSWKRRLSQQSYFW
ncbi:glycosyltransferase family 2 protein [Anthocerotibacter panamensis]|uniref:glycosyltransferase family 2 protein n=1 Tax=Anthocerotibacter panamensis TaxID=2857077 RepID=UPI001C405033|nr:glycosyltransferase family 2 protein [Anthocerotibacter panamensis]